ncbi:cupin domain-containing protein [Candidatus Aminicenantes bacterium AC-335-K20]|jgi:mannose-6-phosphate isomerase-like protein (cupin superfamily)|nr:cupin domain-containing protein [SCandidatus Aminicenantes bacterium Aminicenantia_JdfR_composite]MCP2605496.1 cupin domain-containing protein [Candidatus Aminicenantes bacterium AC-335-O07]MCP2619173.1 cupin domain-containing protein [Candidatus Aminicenantes bacterium AC-335-K20]MCP2620646.1 cupin domain-containing protein [Candidatus Aminicenantes bacterium AC-334-E05]
MKKIVIKNLAKKLNKKFTLKPIATLNNYGVNLVLIEGEYPFHSHNGNEFFLIVEGEIYIDFKDEKPVRLREGEALLVKEGVIHRSRSEKKSIALVFEAKDLSYKMEGGMEE